MYIHTYDWTTALVVVAVNDVPIKSVRLYGVDMDGFVALVPQVLISKTA